MFLIIQGNVVDGLAFHGPFDTAIEANDWADIYLPGETWVCAPIFKPTVID